MLRPALCDLNKASGCEAYIERYFFNKNTSSCEKFIFGGCDGNANNFRNIEDCNNKCAGIHHKLKNNFQWLNLNEKLQNHLLSIFSNNCN